MSEIQQNLCTFGMFRGSILPSRRCGTLCTSGLADGVFCIPERREDSVTAANRGWILERRGCDVTAERRLSMACLAACLQVREGLFAEKNSGGEVCYQDCLVVKTALAMLVGKCTWTHTFISVSRYRLEKWRQFFVTLSQGR